MHGSHSVLHSIAAGLVQVSQSNPYGVAPGVGAGDGAGDGASVAGIGSAWTSATSASVVRILTYMIMMMSSFCVRNARSGGGQGEMTGSEAKNEANVSWEQETTPENKCIPHILEKKGREKKLAYTATTLRGSVAICGQQLVIRERARARVRGPPHGTLQGTRRAKKKSYRDTPPARPCRQKARG